MYVCVYGQRDLRKHGGETVFIVRKHPLSASKFSAGVFQTDYSISFRRVIFQSTPLGSLHMGPVLRLIPNAESMDLTMASKGNSTHFPKNWNRTTPRGTSA